MKGLTDTSGGAKNAGSSVLLRSLRAAGFTLLANPLAFAVAGTCLWLLANLLIAPYREPQGIGGDLPAVLSFAGGVIAFTVLAVLALGHIAVMWITGWRGRRA